MCRRLKKTGKIYFYKVTVTHRTDVAKVCNFSHRIKKFLCILMKGKSLNLWLPVKFDCRKKIEKNWNPRRQCKPRLDEEEERICA
jgi:hypothetical protein